jgi:hypothetical protein
VGIEGSSAVGWNERSDDELWTRLVRSGQASAPTPRRAAQRVRRCPKSVRPSMYDRFQRFPVAYLVCFCVQAPLRRTLGSTVGREESRAWGGWQTRRGVCPKPYRSR